MTPVLEINPDGFGKGWKAEAQFFSQKACYVHMLSPQNSAEITTHFSFKTCYISWVCPTDSSSIIKARLSQQACIICRILRFCKGINTYPYFAWKACVNGSLDLSDEAKEHGANASPAPSVEEAVGSPDCGGGHAKHHFTGRRSSRTQDGRSKEIIDSGGFEVSTTLDHQISAGSQNACPSRASSAPMAARSKTHSRMTLPASAASPEGVNCASWATRPNRHTAALTAKCAPAVTAPCRSEAGARSAPGSAQAVSNAVYAASGCTPGVGESPHEAWLNMDIVSANQPLSLLQ
eukprot:CAMPEP_0172838638 /NCGR_PEP_ID=MMETSP1075-20121228/28014_1 /TAXON_ID=2916 /ORGANISM="Ceratium fusus, Strain PA161109" /LENGTH=291 /DNA_ID=CAMNT_0013682175 /DNA_START=113 /DNA_END=987 /DNA_ORIENTATION=-